MRFSERIGKRKGRCKLQVDSMDDELCNSLWNAIYTHILREINMVFDHSMSDDWKDFFDSIWIDFLKHPVDGLTYTKDWFCESIKNWWFLEADCWDRYDFIEYIGQKQGPYDQEEFISDCNVVLRLG